MSDSGPQHLVHPAGIQLHFYDYTSLVLSYFPCEEVKVSRVAGVQTLKLIIGTDTVGI